MFRTLSLVIAFFTFFVSFSFASFQAATYNSNTDYIASPYNPNFGSNQDFSIEFRINTSTWTGDPSIISDKDWASGYNAGFVISLENNGTGFTVNVGDGTNRADLTAGAINDGLWHHILTTFDRNGFMSLYIDGVLTSQASMANVGNIDSPYFLNIGQDGTQAYGPSLMASLSEVKIWNKLISLSEIERCDTIDISHPSWNDLLVYYRLDENVGSTTAIDSKGTLDGTYQGTVVLGGTNQFSSGCGSFSSNAFNGIGSGNSLDFDGISQYASVPNNNNLRPAVNMTLECWFYPRSFSDEWTSPLSHAVDNSGTESGYDFSWTNGKLRFRVKTSSQGSNTWDNSAGTDAYEINKWQHIAGVYNGDSIYFYLNGVLKEKIAATGAINWDNLPTDFRIGSFHDSNEDWYFDGKLDEIRVWNIARSQTEIRSTMCSKLVGNELGLAAYYRLDESNTLQVKDAGVNALNGNTTNMGNQAYDYSGAYIGDASQFIYPSSWTGQTLSINSSAQGSLSIQTIQNNPSGLHLFRIDHLPNTINGLGDYGNNQTYFGVFFTNQASGTAQFSYANYPQATANETNLNLYKRAANNVSFWAYSNATLNTGSNSINISNLNSSSEIILSGFSPNPCNPVEVDSISNFTTSTADVFFNGLGNNPIQIQALDAGANIVFDTLFNNPSSGSITIHGLVNNSSFEVYIRQICSGSDTSAWSGPYIFQTVDACPMPTNVVVNQITGNSATINWTSNGGNWDLEYGLATFQQGSGINANFSVNPRTIYGLSPLTQYKFYIRNNCGSQVSSWAGPFYFTTDSLGTGIQTFVQEKFQLDPNPGNGLYNLFNPTKEIRELTITNSIGETIANLNLSEGDNVIDLTQFPEGIYFFTIGSKQTHGNVHFKVIQY